jgi:hypothetical protein
MGSELSLLVAVDISPSAIQNIGSVVGPSAAERNSCQLSGAMVRGP